MAALLTQTFGKSELYKTTPELKQVLRKLIGFVVKMDADSKTTLNDKVKTLLTTTEGVEFLKSILNDTGDIVKKIMDYGKDKVGLSTLEKAINDAFDPNDEYTRSINKLLKDNIDTVAKWEGFEAMLGDQEGIYFQLVGLENLKDVETEFNNIKTSDEPVDEEPIDEEPIDEEEPVDEEPIDLDEEDEEPVPAPVIVEKKPLVKPIVGKIKMPLKKTETETEVKPLIKAPAKALITKLEVGTLLHVKDKMLDLSLYDKAFLAGSLGPSKLLIVDVIGCSDRIYPLVFRIHKTLTKENVLKFIVNGINAIIAEGYTCTEAKQTYTVKEFDNKKTRYCYISVE